MLSCTWRNPIGSKDTNKLRVIVTRKEKEIASAISRGTTTRTHSRRTRHYIASRDDRRMSNRVGPANFSSSQFSKNPKFKVQCKLTTIPSHHHQIYFPTPLNPMLPSEKNRRSQNKLKSFTKHNFTIININIIYKFPNQTKKNYIKI